MRVAIIDDSNLNLRLVEALLARVPGCEPVLFSDPAEALRAAQLSPPDLVIVDYLMPGLTGLDVITELRRRHGTEQLPILMVTADHERELRYAALKVGASDFLTRPLDAVEFRARVRNALAVRRGWLAMQTRAEELAEAVEKATERVRARELEAIYRLSRAAELRDPETGAHILRMAHYSCVIARNLGWSESRVETLLHAAPMHDVGKVGTPDRILLKPGKLEPDEWEVMKQHAELGARILQGSEAPMLQLAAEIALAHHEKYDGSGYPRGLVGAAIPEAGRIVAVADVFDALTSDRPYKRAWDLDRARAMLIEGRGSHFDPACVDAFLASWAEVLEIRDRYRDP